MTQPRCIRPEVTWSIRRAVVQGFFLLLPSEAVNQVVDYCLAEAARQTGVQVHAYLVQLHEIQIVASDSRGRLPTFAHRLFRHISMCLKEHWDWDGCIWEPGKLACTELRTPETILDAMDEVLLHPIEAALVAELKEWRGAYSRPSQIDGRERPRKRPGLFFRDRIEGRFCPLRLTMPQTLQTLGFRAESFAQDYARHFRRKEKAKRREVKGCGRGFVGAKRLARYKHSDRASGKPRARQPAPAVRSSCPTILAQALEALRTFRLAYREARERFREGERVEFPQGTWWYRVFFGVSIAAT